MLWNPELETFLPETLELNATVESMLAKSTPVELENLDRARQDRRDGSGWAPAPVFLDEAEDMTCPGPVGDIPLRVFRSPSPTGIYLHIHGGGWVLGGADLQDPALERIAKATGLTCVSVDYRLAPENPHPAGDDDCEAAALWVMEHAADVFGAPNRVVIGGESAGGHLTLMTLLRLRDRHDALGPIVGANLVYPVADFGGTPSQRSWGDRFLVLSSSNLAWFYDCYLPGLSMAERQSPSISPIYADLSNLPPTLLTIGTLDPLLDDSLFLASRLQAAGNVVELAAYPESMHGFNAFPTEMARAANHRITDWISRLL